MEYTKINKNVSAPFSENVEKLAKLFPSVVKDGKLDLDELRAQLGEFDEVSRERYSLTWAGKINAQKKTGEALVGKTLKYIEAESKNPETTQNIYIEGDNLEALKLLQNAYRGKIKMIYIDPPYNTDGDLIFNDKYKERSQDMAIREGDAEIVNGEVKHFIKNTKSNGAYHSNWLSMMYSRLTLARNLLTEKGAIFISIDDDEISQLKGLCDEIFGMDNFVSLLIYKKRNGGGNDSQYIAVDHEYILVYLKNNSYTKNEWKWRVPYDISYLKRYKEISETGRRYYWDTLARDNLKNPIPLKLIAPDGQELIINSQKSEKTVLDEMSSGEIKFTKSQDGWTVHHRVYMPEGKVLRSVLADCGTNEDGGDEIKSIFGANIFSYAKPSKLIQTLCELFTSNDDIILDFFSGSGTTAQSIMQLNAKDNGNRKFILVQFPEEIDCSDKNSETDKEAIAFCDSLSIPRVISEIGKERIRRAGDKIKAEHPLAEIDTGFKVFRVDDTNIRWIAAEKGTPGVTLEDALSASSKDLRDFMSGTNDLDVVYEILIRQYDIPLTAKINPLIAIGKRTFSIADTLIVCLEEDITAEIIDKLAAIEPIPQKIIFRDSAFGDDITLKENAMMRLDALMQKHASGGKQPYSVEFL